MTSSLKEFMHSPAAGGILLGLCAILAIIVANSPLKHIYDLLLATPVVVQVGALVLAKPLLLWVNDGLMAVFFFMVGLELKRECLYGELDHWKKAVLPSIGALGGMIVPALGYLLLNYDDPMTRGGWAIPAATDIAFALGVLSLLGDRVPLSLKIFLTSLAIFDDVGAILIIAFFYTSKISIISLVISALAVVILWCLNRKGVNTKSPYIFVGIIMWIAVLKSGVHATLAGVVLALFIPAHKSAKFEEGSMLHHIEYRLHGVVTFAILPIFAFCNSGLTLIGLTVDDVFHKVPMGIVIGLFLGKQIGVFSFSWLAIKTGLAELPKGMGTLQLYGVSVLTGIGFTMSLFIGSLAFDASSVDRLFDERLGILIGSLLSGVVGYLILKVAIKRIPEEEHEHLEADGMPSKS